jgi:rSAM/selenodomain-associated transferase 2
MFTAEGAEMPDGCQEQKGKMERISAVIPVLNAAHLLPPLLAQLKGLGEVILADGGSTDGVAELAGVRVITATRGRGTQLGAGAAAARGEWLLFLHADTRLEPGWEAAVAAALARPGSAHHFRFALDDDSPQARRLEAAVAWRCRWLALPYGDQGLLISRALYEAVGGYAAIPLMEDVDLVRRLGRARLAELPARAITSAARWRRDGWWRRSARNLTTLGLYFAGVPPERLARFYR